ncbi:MAG: DUF2029 domain-containing protein [Pedobacter sp.]|nr:MAG: DUF2029 domain-containing protein [Pedobacter sp.]
MKLPLSILPTFKGDKNKAIAFAFWMLITVFCTLQSIVSHRYNNYLIFENTFRNLIHQTSFYASYPVIHFDINHYGPVFSIFIAPFAMLPNAVGLFFWNLFNAVILFKAIESIPLQNKNSIYFIAIPCLITASLSEQFNPAVGAFIILSYTLLNKDKGLWSTMLIMLGTFIKLYGIVGLAFFFFVKDKKRFVIYLFIWALVFFIMPMVFSSPSFVISSYKEWGASLIDKNASNITEPTLDISIMGFVRTLFTGYGISNMVFLILGVLIFALPYLRLKAYSNTNFQLLILGSTLMFPVLFSTGTEDCTYIIASASVGIWYLISERKSWKTVLVVVAILLSLNLPLVLFRKLATQNPISLTVLSLPFFIIWILIIMETYRIKINDQRHE